MLARVSNTILRRRRTVNGPTAALLGALLFAFAVDVSAAQAVADQGTALHYEQIKHSSAGIDYVTGGVGDEATQELRQFASDNGYNLKGFFTLNTGNFVSDVRVALKNERGRTLVDDVADGPMFFAKVPPGNYSLTATYEKKTETQKMRIGQRDTRVAYFRWPANPQTDVALGRSSKETSSGGGKSGSGR
jgi:hypothetical protein